MQTHYAGIIMERLMSAFSRMLLHSLWQGIILAIVAWLVVVLTKKQKAAVRYNLILILFATFLMTTIFTFTEIWYTGNTENSTTSFASSLGDTVSLIFDGNLQTIRHLIANAIGFLATHEQFIFVLWLIIFSFRIIKMSGAILYNQQIKRKQVFVTGKYWTDTVERLCSSLQIHKAVVLLESAYMKMPVVIGHLKPVILMPVGLLMSMPAEQAEAILLHELAHIRRNDYLVNFLQHIAETIFFFNPAVLWISSWLREERENCCDDIALEQTQNKTGLAQALISFKQHELYGNIYTTAFPGKKNQLLRRVGRILGSADKKVTILEKLFLLGAFVLLLTGTGAMMLVHEKEIVKKTISDTKRVNPPMTQHILPENKLIEQKGLTTKIVAGRKKINVFEKTVSIKNTAVIEPAPMPEQTELLTAKQTSLADEQRATLDQERAKKDQEYALKDQARSKKDQQQAQRDQKQAILDQEQAMRDQVNAKLDMEQANIQYQKALQDKKDAERESLKKPVIF